MKCESSSTFIPCYSVQYIHFPFDVDSNIHKCRKPFRQLFGNAIESSKLKGHTSIPHVRIHCLRKITYIYIYMRIHIYIYRCIHHVLSSITHPYPKTSLAFSDQMPWAFHGFQAPSAAEPPVVRPRNVLRSPGPHGGSLGSFGIPLCLQQTILLTINSMVDPDFRFQ